MTSMEKKKRALVLINKTAGTGKAGTDSFNIITRLAESGYEPVVYPIIPGTELSSDILIGQYEGKIDLILCSGGDGTLNHVVSAMMDLEKKPLLAYVPAGSTNDFANSLHLSSDIMTAVDDIING